MSVKVIDPGPFLNANTLICGKCGALLGYMPTDVKEGRTKADFLGDSESYHYIECAQCKQEIRVP